MELKLTLFGVDILGRGSATNGTSVGPNLATGAELLEIGRLTPEAALARLDSTLDGLLDRQARERLGRYGPNEVAHEKHKSPMRRLLELFFTPLSVLLLGLAAVNYATGEVKGAVVISLMVVLSSLLSFMQEFRSSKAAERLRAMVSTTATVLRKDRRLGIPEEVKRHFRVVLRPKGPARKERARRQRVPPVPAYGTGADSGQQPALRLFADYGCHRQCR